ncbi:hypothetical protein LY76DRAFT_346759 [Colletotrichum caudatum]|nr:hypothetical protein LY76DRAFT_346759 [Colletotrichum caudatum]
MVRRQHSGYGLPSGPRHVKSGIHDWRLTARHGKQPQTGGSLGAAHTSHTGCQNHNVFSQCTPAPQGSVMRPFSRRLAVRVFHPHRNCNSLATYLPAFFSITSCRLCQISFILAVDGIGVWALGRNPPLPPHSQVHFPCTPNQKLRCSFARLYGSEARRQGVVTEDARRSRDSESLKTMPLATVDDR